jgi:hypothetical protein
MIHKKKTGFVAISVSIGAMKTAWPDKPRKRKTSDICALIVKLELLLYVVCVIVIEFM